MRISVPTEHTRMSGVSSGTSACGRGAQQQLGGLAAPAGLLGRVQHSSACMCGCTQRSCRPRLQSTGCSLNRHAEASAAVRPVWAAAECVNNSVSSTTKAAEQQRRTASSWKRGGERPVEKTSSESGANSVIQQRLKRSSFSCVASAWSTWQGRSVWVEGVQSSGAEACP